MNEEISKLLRIYEEKKEIIKKFLADAKRSDEEHLTAELVFCLQTPQSKAKHARETVTRLKACNKLMCATEEEIRSMMQGVRFPNRKSGYIYEAIKKVKEIKKNLSMSTHELREWLVKNVKGFGMKEASHYLRNIGINGLAILDVHVQRFMKKNFKFVGEVGSLTKKQYIENEKLFLEFAREMGIPPEELDIAIWLCGNAGNEFYG
jgi:N-glycosylase/DNA lyase